ncbi:hypothetical protein V2B37_03850 [Natranaerobius thermophilus JW/NM-WN-LF]
MAGVGANLLKTAIEHAAYKKGYTNQTGLQKAGGFFMSARHVNTPLGKLNGWIADNSVAAILGICKSYLFSLSGRDYPIVKGVALGDMSWAFAYGVLAKMGASSLQEEDPKTAFTVMISHMVFGAASAIILRSVANPNLFPRK